MFFTQEDYNKIYNWIKLHSIKDSEFNDSKPLDGRETITVVQQGHNVKFILQDFLEQLALFNIPDFVNVTERYNLKYISLFEATKAIPYRLRKIGQVVTFLDEDGNWRIYQFRGENVNQWDILTLWVDILGEIIDKGSIIPDEEDLTAIKEGNKTVVKFKDKAYNPDNFSGKGRVYLRKNIVEVIDYNTKVKTTKNLLTQSMFGWEDTYYFIQYDYDLNGQTVIIPEDSTLIFIGGSINNGTLNCINTTIQQFNGTTNLTGNYKLGNFLYTDDEDITKDIDLTLKFADKEYNPANFSGLGRVYLRKNIVDVEQEDCSIVHRNILTQDMINEPNTRYIIQYDFDLNEQEITIPEGCILDFQGGSLNNGTLKENNFTVQSAPYYIFKNIIFNCTIDNEVLGNWFGVNINNTDNSEFINNAILAAGVSLKISHSYSNIRIKKPIIISKVINIDINGSIVIYEDMEYAILLQVPTSRRGCKLYNGHIKCNRLAEKGLVISQGNRHIIRDIEINGFSKYAIECFQVVTEYPCRVDISNITIDNNLKLLDTTGIKFSISDSTISNVEICNCNIGIDVSGGGSVFTNIHGWTAVMDIYPNSYLFQVSGYGQNLYIACTSDTLRHLVKLTRDYVIASFISPYFYIDSLYKDNEVIINNPPLVVDKNVNSYINITALTFNNDSYYKIIDESVLNDRDRINVSTYPLKGASSYLNKFYTENSLSGNLVYDKTIGFWKIYDTENPLVLNFNFNSGTIYPSEGKILQLSTGSNYERYTAFLTITVDGTNLGYFFITVYNDIQSTVKYNITTFNNSPSFINNFKFYIVNNILYFKSNLNCSYSILASSNINKVDLDVSEQIPLNINIISQGFYGDSEPTKNNAFTTGSIYFKTSDKKPFWFYNNNWLDALGNDINIKYSGATLQRPTNINAGFQYFDTDLNKSIWWNGTEWVDSEGNDADSTPVTSGTFANKPTGVDIGYAYFCTDKQTTEGTTNGIMIYYKGSNTWVDALGRVIS